MNTKKITMRIDRLYNNTPKDSGWFGAWCTVKRENKPFRNGEEIVIKGTARDFTPREGLYIQADVVMSKDKQDIAYDIKSPVLYIGTQPALKALLKLDPNFKNLDNDVADRLWKQYGKETKSKVLSGCKELQQPEWDTDTLNILRNRFTDLFLEQAILERMPAATKKIARTIANFYYNHGVPLQEDDTSDWLYIPDPIAHLEQNPYYPIHEIAATNAMFKACDSMGDTQHLAKDDNRRLHGAICASVSEYLESSGSTYLNMTEHHVGSDKATLAQSLYALLYNDTRYLQSYPVYQWLQYPLVKQAITIADTLCQKPGRLYNDALWLKEQEIAASLADLISRDPLLQTTAKELQEEIDNWETKHQMQLSQEQRNAVANILCHRVAVLTGGPGSGKTEIISCICEIWQTIVKRQKYASETPHNTSSETSSKVVLSAPTGMAAKNMANRLKDVATEQPKTIMFRYVCGNSVNNALCVLDETSMVSLDWMTMFLENSGDSQLLFVGDIDQLPSVGAGCILQDLMKIPQIPVFRLTKCYRTNAGTLLDNAKQIISGDASKPLKYDENFQITAYVNNHPVTDQEAADIAVSKYLHARECYSPKDIALLCPVKSSNYACGVDALNKRIQEAVNPTQDAKPVYGLYSGTGNGNTMIRINDRVVFTKNIVSLNLINGDCGTIIDADKEQTYVLFEKDEPSEETDLVVKIPKAYWEHLQLAYALTIHKSQGSEYKEVIIPLPAAGGKGWFPPGFFSRNLFYTAITRAKEKVHLIAQSDSINMAICGNPGKRNSSLVELVEEQLQYV